MRFIRFAEVQEDVLEKARESRDENGNYYNITTEMTNDIAKYFAKMDLRIDLNSSRMYSKSLCIEYPSGGPIKADREDAILRFKCEFLNQVQRIKNGYGISLPY